MINKKPSQTGMKHQQAGNFGLSVVSLPQPQTSVQPLLFTIKKIPNLVWRGNENI